MMPVSVDFTSKWEDLRQIVFKLIRCESVSREKWNCSFVDVYALCCSRPVSHAPLLYSSTTAMISSRVKEITAEIQQVDDTRLLPLYVKHWQVFHDGITWLDNLYRFVNQQYVKNLRPTEAEMCYSAVLPLAERHMMEILEVGLAHWKLFLIDSIKDRLTSCLMREVQNDRFGITGQQNCICPCIDSLLRVGELRDIERAGMDVYNEIFHNPLMEATVYFYTAWATKHESDLEFSQYISEALALRNEEERRASTYYNCSFERVLFNFQHIIVEKRLAFLNQSIPRAVATEHKADLHNLFRLLASNKLYSELSNCFSEHIKTQVHEAILALPQDLLQAPVQFVENLLQIRNRFTRFIDEVFDGLSTFRNQMDKAFNSAINERVANPQRSIKLRPAELLSRYMDSLLRKPLRSISESEVDAKLIAAITIFKYLDDKDVFQKYYQRLLCKRLISCQTVAMELEESVINQLKLVCGYEFTSKFHRMFNDVQLAPEVNKNFTQYLETQRVEFKFNHHFNVLAQCSWPMVIPGSVGFTLPHDLQQCTSHFEAFYCSSYQGRKIRWAHHCSTADLTLRYTDKPYQVQVPAVHAAILLLFDTLDSDRIQLRDLQGHLQLSIVESQSGSKSTPQEEQSTDTVAMDTSSEGCFSSEEQDVLKRALTPLLDINMLRLESSEPLTDTTAEGNQLVPGSWLVLNHSFTHKRLKIRINFGQQNKDTVQKEAEQVERQVSDDRRYFIQAAVVRIMKSEKQIDHSTLIKCVLQQATGRFQPSVPLIKRCVENLIDKGYLERNPDNSEQYNYLA